MGYPHGLFTWADLAAPDLEKAKAFYSGLLGWGMHEEPTPQGPYVMAMLGDKPVAGMMTQPPEQQQAGVPPMWTSYILVEGLDQVATQVEQLGGKLHAPPFDVMESGRMAIIQDPTGAYVALWEAGTHEGAGVFNEPGAMSWNELNTRDAQKAMTFYQGLLGWGIDSQDMGGGRTYHVIKVGERDNGGIMQMDENWPAEVPAHWVVYFTIADLDASVAKVTDLGGAVTVSPMDIQIGRLAVVADDQGGTFTLFEAKPQ